MERKTEQGIEETALPHKRICLAGKELLIFREVTSTNNLAMQLARAGASENTIVLSSLQKAGQGRLGRQWSCPVGQGLMMSLILKPDIEWQLVPQLNLLCGVAVAEAVKKATGCAAGIKWPNDVVLNGKKICGIMAQSNFAKSMPSFVVMGLGLNVNLDPRQLPPDCRETSTSLKQELSRKVSRWLILQQFITSWEEHYQRFLREGHAYLRQKWLEKNVTLGRTVFINRNQGNSSLGLVEGQAVDISERGGLIVSFADGSREEYMAEDISLGRTHYSKG